MMAALPDTTFRLGYGAVRYGHHDAVEPDDDVGLAPAFRSDHQQTSMYGSNPNRTAGSLGGRHSCAFHQGPPRKDS